MDRKEYKRLWMQSKRRKEREQNHFHNRGLVDNQETCFNEEVDNEIDPYSMVVDADDVDHNYDADVMVDELDYDADDDDNYYSDNNPMIDDPVYAVEAPFHNDIPISSDESEESGIDEDYCDNPIDWNLLDGLLYEYSSDDDDLDAPGNEDLKKDLAHWVSDNKIPHSASDKLLNILRKYHDLPKTTKSLYEKHQPVNILSKSGGRFYHVGLEAMTKNLDRYELTSIPENLQLSLNLDGLPLFRSSRSNFWPILGSFTNLKPRSVFMISIFHGHSKPTDLEFLQPVIDDLKKVLTEGLEYKQTHLNITIEAFIMDGPARCLAKGTKLVSGYYGCDMCETKGKYVGRVTFPKLKAKRRTDESFRAQTNKPHHHLLSPLTQLPVDMIANFPIDYMHQVRHLSNAHLVILISVIYVCSPFKGLLVLSQ